MSSRRDSLRSVLASPDFHPGLWLDRYVSDLGKKGEGKQRHLDALVGKARIPACYRLGFRRWREQLLASPPHTAYAEVSVRGRMVVGLGAESVLETSLALHHTYGVPYLPGSGLKGVAATAAHKLLEGADWRKAVGEEPAGEAFRALFGEIESSGCVTFQDGLLIPDETEDLLPFQRDVMTPHHSAYYQGSGDEAPAEWDDPVPVAFLTTGGRYLVAVTGPKAWAEAGLEILLKGLSTLGAGAKTDAGYGRLTVSPRKGKKNGDEPTPPGSGLDPAPRTFAVNEEVRFQVKEAGGQQVTLVETETGQEVKVARKGRPWEVGKVVKLKIKKVGGDGLIKEVG